MVLVNPAYLDERYGTGSPRTSALPMACTTRELLRGAFVAWITFNALLLMAIVIIGVVSSFNADDASTLFSVPAALMLAVLNGGPISFFAFLLIGLPVGLLFTKAMRRVKSLVIHTFAFGMVGFGAGGAVWVLLAWLNYLPKPGEVVTYSVRPGFWSQLDWWGVLLAAVLTGLSVGLGWQLTMRRALRDDNRLRKPRGAESQEPVPS